MTIFQSVILGIIQGLGEFLPISSSGHLLLARLVMGIQDNQTSAMKMFDVLLHVGTLLPVALVFYKDWLAMLRHPIRNRTLALLFMASLPTLVIYLLAKVILPEAGGFRIFDSGWFLGVSFLLSSIFLLFADRLSRQSVSGRRVTFPVAVLMGIFQGIGMIPGVSRSGSTITGGVACGLKKETAAKFSFMMSAPAILASLLMEGKDAIEEGYYREIELIPSIIGIFIAAVCGFLAIRFMLKVISRISLSWFALYLAIIGVMYLVLQIANAPFLPSFTPVTAFG